MTSYMTVMVRVVANRAQAQLEALRRAQMGLASGIATTNRMSPLGARHIPSLIKFGNQLQWTGRMLLYNFTLPIAAAGIAATKWSMDQAKAMTHVAKVYGDTRDAARFYRQESDKVLTAVEAETKAHKVFRQELEALDDAFTALSNHYGVTKSEVNEIAGAWAAAGVSGVKLAESVRSTLTAMIIGDMEHEKATKSLIAIQAQYNLSSKELLGTLATLNSVENETGASMADLIDGFARAAGVARSAGVDVNYLSAMIAALVPATGTASNAGNALKTIMSRLLAPTKEAVQVMEEMGLKVTAMNWQSSTAIERLQMMAEEYNGLGAAARNAASSVIASRWQINKFEVLMREIVNTTGYYEKALKSAEDQGASFKRMQEELNTVLESDPRRMQRMWVMLQNAMVDIIQPLIPFILYLADSLADLATGFSDLEPHTQKLIIFGAVFLAFVGPVVRYLGALTTLSAVFMIALTKAGGALLFFNRALMAITFLPLLKGLSILATWIGGTSGLIIAQGTVWTKIYMGFLGFFSKWTSAVAAIFRAGNILNLKIIATGWAAKIGVMRAALATKLLSIKVFFLKMRLLFIAGALSNQTTWATMWAVLKMLTVTGLAGQFALFRKMLGLTAITRVLGGAIVVAWRTTWAMIHAISVAGWTLMRAQWIAQAVLGIGIWTRFRTAFVTIHATIAALVSTIWRGIALTMIASSKAAVAGVIGAFKALIPFMLMIGKFILGPWGIAIAAVIGLAYVFRDQIVQIWNNILSYFGAQGSSITDIFSSMGEGIMSVFNALPQGVQNAMVAVVTIIRDAALAVYDWFSYINPFAQHSPSLVENVTRGMTEVNRQFSTLSNIKKHTSAAYAEIKRFGQLTAKLGISAAAAQQAEDRATLKKAGAGQALASYNRLTGILNRLTPILKTLEGQMNAQQRVVDGWKKKVDAATRSLERQQSKLNDLQGTLDKWQSKLNEAEDSLQHYASAPLEGMREMERRIFRNQVAQTKLRWEMMKFEDVNGTFDELRSKVEAVNGAQEMLRGTQASLRAAGAGSDVLGHYDEEIAKLEDQKDTYKEATDELSKMQARLDELERQGQRLDLTKAMKFDELQWQIDMAANRMKEMPFDEIMQGIKNANTQIDKYGPKVDAASAAVDRQQAVVDRLTAARDRLQDRLDKEERTLARIKERYDSVNSAISAIKDSLSDVMGAAKDLNSKLDAKKSAAAKKKGAEEYVSPGLANFRMAGDADFPDPGGKGMPLRTDWSSQAKDIRKFTEQLGMDTATIFEQLNPFAPLKGKAIAVWDWIKQKAKDTFFAIGDFIGNVFSGINMGGGANKFFDFLEEAGEFATEVIRDIAKVIGWAWELLGPDIKKIGKGIENGLKAIWNKVGPELEAFGELWGPMGQAIKNLWSIAKPILAVIVGRFLLMGKVLFSIVAETIGPLLEHLGTIFAGIIRIIRGALQIIVGLLTLDFKMVWEGVKNILSGAWDVIKGIFVGALGFIKNLVVGFVKGVYGFFKWLYDKLVGNSVVPDMIDGILAAFQVLVDLGKWVWKKVLWPVFKVFVVAYKDIMKELKGWWKGITKAWSNISSDDWWKKKVLKPLEDEIKGWWKDRVAGFKSWWKDVTNAWNNIKSAEWWSRNVLAPLVAKITSWWRDRKEQFRGWWDGIKQAWSNIKSGEWWNKNVLKPIYDAIVSIFRNIKDWFRDNAATIMKPILGLVNDIIRGINTMIKGVNKISDVLPGINFQIKLIPELAEGGALMNRRVGNGFRTNGARAIVGEGKANHPEYVIPTDPTHRGRAKQLLAEAASRMGIATDAAFLAKGGVIPLPPNSGFGIPSLSDISGAVSGAISGIKSVGSYLEEKGRNALVKLINPFLDMARDKVSGVEWPLARAIGNAGINTVERWVKGAANAYQNMEEKLGPKVTGNISKRGWVTPAAAYSIGEPPEWRGGYRGHTGQDLPGGSGSVIRAAHSGNVRFITYPGSNDYNNTPYRSYGKLAIVSGPGAATYYGHLLSYTGSERAVKAGEQIGKMGMNGNATGVHLHYEVRTARGLQDPINWHRRVGAPLKDGGIVRRTTGGVLARIGEGTNDEAVTPLPRNWKTEGIGGKTEINIYGDLEFPNISDGGDAETFIENLKILAGD